MSLEKFPDFLLNFSVPEIDGKETRSFAFKSFRLDLSERQLVNAGVPVPLTPKAFDVLAFLVIRGGHLVEKDELLRAVWADSFVEEANVARIIHTLRKILGEDQNGNKFIETVAKKGYRFVAEVTPDDGPHGHSHENAGALDIWPTDLIDVSDPPQTAAEAKFYSDQKISRRPILTGLAVVLALFLISFLVFGWNGGKPAIVSIAILPFRSVTNENQEYKLGIADSLISRFISAKNLTVRPLASTWKYLDSEIDPVAAGKEQNVDFTVASSLQVAEGKIRVTSQLINVKSGAVVETF